MTGSSKSASDVLWTFEDRADEVLVTTDVPEEPGASFDVQIGGDFLFVRSQLDGKDTSLLNVKQLYSTVDVTASSWELSSSKERLTVRLKKLDPATVWPQLEAESGVIKPDDLSGDPLEARKAVQALLSAARAGDVEAFKGAAQRFDGSDLSSVKDANGRNALHFSASSGKTDFVQYLVAKETFEVDTADDSG